MKSTNQLVKYLAVALTMGAIVTSLTACNTIHGVGKDTEKAGEKIQQEATEHSDKDGAKSNLSSENK